MLVRHFECAVPACSNERHPNLALMNKCARMTPDKSDYVLEFLDD